MVTLKDIAARAGVNVSSVSKALNDSREISQEKKREIQRIAKEMNYVPNLSARALAGKGTNSIGIILPEIQSNLYANIMNCVEDELYDTKYSMIMSTTNWNLQNEIKYMNVLCSRSVDGILLIGTIHSDIERYVAEIQKMYKIPVIILESNTEIRDHDNIMIDTEYGFDLAIRHFIALGYEEIGFISERVSAEVRLPNFTKVLTDNRVKVRKRFIKIGDERFELGGYLRMKELLAEKDFPRAVLASYDDMAIGALRAIYEAGYRVPDDISVIGYDNIRVSEYLVSPLSTIAPPVREMVNIGVKMLLDKIENPQDTRKHKISIKPDLVLRATTKQ